MSRSKIVCSLVVALALSACAKAPSYEGKWVPHSVECFPGAEPVAKVALEEDHAFSLTIKDDAVTTAAEQKSAKEDLGATVTNEVTYRITESKDSDLTLRLLKKKNVQGDAVDEEDFDKHPVPQFYKGSFVEKDGKLVVKGFRANASAQASTQKKDAAGKVTKIKAGTPGTAQFSFLNVEAKDENDQKIANGALCQPAKNPAPVAAGAPTVGVSTQVKAYIYKKAE